MNAPSLAGKIALVTGASRGVGKGIALALGSAGATVFVTGRSRLVDGAGVHEIAGTIDETAAEITRRGGKGIALACDHGIDAEVERVFAEVDRRGPLDVLVNNAFAIPGDPFMNVPFWEAPLAHWDVFQGVGLRSHYAASVLAARRMIPNKRGLIVNVSSFGGAAYAVSVAYGVAKAGVDRMARDMAIELKPHGIAAVSLWPGIVRTERLIAMGDASPFDLGKGESPEFAGRAVVALAADPEVISRTGKAWIVADLAEAYDFTDLDGTRPRAFSKPAKR